MSHSFPITVHQPTKLSIKPPPMIYDFESTKNRTERFPVPTPPLSSASPTVELAPMMDLCDLIGKNSLYFFKKKEIKIGLNRQQTSVSRITQYKKIHGPRIRSSRRKTS